MVNIRKNSASLKDIVAALCRTLLSGEIFDGYRPELHYMRGPGPKWQAKHGFGEPAAVPVVARGLPLSRC